MVSKCINKHRNNEPKLAEIAYIFNIIDLESRKMEIST